MDATWSDLLEALESPSSVSVSLPTFPPHESAVACSDSDSYQLELVVRAAQRKRRLEAQAQDAGKAFEDAICAYFFHPSTLPLQNHQQPGRGLVRSKSLASTPLSRGRRQWKFPSSPLTPASSQLWLDSARRLEELDRSVDLMLEDTSKERRFVSTIRPRYSPNASATVKKTCYHMGSLPSEVLIQIFLQLSKDSSSVLSITHVNYRWREIALGIPSLFTSTALWDKWSLPLLKEWIARTKGKPLSVKLSNEALLRMHTEDNIRALIHDVCMEELDVTVATFGQSGDALNACRAILHLEMPLLRKLRLVGSNDIGICSPILDVPGRLITSLTHLRLSNALLIFKDYDTAEKRDLDPSPSRSLAIDNASVPTGSWIGFWRGCHGFNAMKLSRCGVSEGHLTSPPPSLELPNITRMVFSESTGVLGLTMIRSCRFSNLRHLTIKGGPALTEEMWIALARCAPKLSTISMYSLERAVVEFLDARIDQGIVPFPTLEHLTVIAPYERNQAFALEGCSVYEIALIRYIDSRYKQHLPPLSALTVSRACTSCRNTLMDLERSTTYGPQYIKKLKVVKLRDSSLDCISLAYIHA